MNSESLSLNLYADEAAFVHRIAAMHKISAKDALTWILFVHETLLEEVLKGGVVCIQKFNGNLTRYSNFLSPRWK